MAADLAGDLAGERDHPALAAAYGAGAPGPGSRAALEAIVTIVPRPRWIMPGSKLLMVCKVAVRLPSTGECQSSSGPSATGRGRARPQPTKTARTPARPSCRSACWRSRSAAAASVQSPATPMAWPPSVCMGVDYGLGLGLVAAVDGSLGAVGASTRPVATPIPPEPPVTTATLPARSGWTGSLLLACIGRLRMRGRAHCRA